MADKIIGKKDLVSLIAKKGAFTKKKAEIALNAFIDVVTENLAKKSTIRIIPFGSFEVRHRESREGRNPRSGEKITIAARNVPVFKAGKGLKDAVN